MRLIDADELINEMKNDDAFDSYELKMILENIENSPTAYDVDKVVENLEEMKSINGSMKTKLCIKFDEMTVNRAIEIVKQGVKEQK